MNRQEAQDWCMRDRGAPKQSRWQQRLNVVAFWGGRVLGWCVGVALLAALLVEVVA